MPDFYIFVIRLLTFRASFAAKVSLTMLMRVKKVLEKYIFNQYKKVATLIQLQTFLYVYVVNDSQMSES